MKINNRKSINEFLNKFDYLAKSEDYIEITEWTNEEGVDIIIGTSQNLKFISLSFGEIEAINSLSSLLKNNIKF